MTCTAGRVNFFTVLRQQPQALVCAIERTPYARAEFQLAAQLADDPLEDARCLFVLANQGRAAAASGSNHSGWRTARNPAHPRPPREFTAAHLGAIARRLKHVQIEHDDALAVIARYDTPATLHYVDPPYLRATRAAHTSAGYAHDLSAADHRVLAERLRQVDGMVVLSAYPCQLYQQLYAQAGWRRIDRHTRADRGRLRVESLWLNPAAQRRPRQTCAPVATKPTSQELAAERRALARAQVEREQGDRHREHPVAERLHPAALHDGDAITTPPQPARDPPQAERGRRIPTRFRIET